jgi:DDE superfamily endonuclease
VHRWLLAHPRVQLHFTPTYSSWISQVERWFAELQRRCLDRGVFCSLDELTTALEEWIELWNATARPFKWTKTADQIIDRICRYCSRISGPGHSRATASWAADSDTRSEKARIRARADGSPSAAARSSSRAWRRSWSMLGRPGSSDTTSPHGPGSHVGSVRRRSCRKSTTRNRGGLKSCPRTRRRPLTPTGRAYSARTGPSS